MKQLLDIKEVHSKIMDNLPEIQADVFSSTFLPFWIGEGTPEYKKEAIKTWISRLARGNTGRVRLMDGDTLICVMPGLIDTNRINESKVNSMVDLNSIQKKSAMRSNVHPNLGEVILNDAMRVKEEEVLPIKSGEGEKQLQLMRDFFKEDITELTGVSHTRGDVNDSSDEEFETPTFD